MKPAAPRTGDSGSGSGAARPPRSARRRAREFALQGVYQWLIGGADGAAVEGDLIEREGLKDLEKKSDLAHLREVMHGAIEHADDLRAQFAPFLDRPIAELSPIEHACLLIGTYELKHRAEIPYRVIINEAVELTKSFGGTEGFRFVNGVLDKVAARLRPEAGRS
jgi:N utilization substance protein B